MKKMKFNKYSLFAIITALFIWIILGFSREHLVPFNSSIERASFLLTGDEPEYLLAAYSVAHDLDMDLHNNLLTKSWEKFWIRPVCGPSHGDFAYFKRVSSSLSDENKSKWGKKQLLVHRPGTSIIISSVTFFKKNIRWWAYFTISTLTALCIFFVTMRLHRHEFPIIFVALLCAFTVISPPSIFYSNQIFPEIPVSMLFLLSFVLLLKPSTLNVILASFCIAFSTWFSDRAIFPAIFLGIACFLLTKGKKMKSLVLFIFMINAIFLAFYFYRRFGVPYPIHHNPRVSPSLNYIFKGLPGILFDRNKGILWLSPMLILSPVAFIMWWKSRLYPKLCFFTGLAFASSLLAVSSFPDWSGGTCPTGRYGVLFQWLTLPAFLVWSKSGMNTKQKAMVLFLFFIGLLQTIFIYDHPNWWYRKYSPIFEYKCLYPIYNVMPDMQTINKIEVLKVMFWTFSFALYSLTAYFPVTEIIQKICLRKRK